MSVSFIIFLFLNYYKKEISFFIFTFPTVLPYLIFYSVYACVQGFNQILEKLT